MFAILATCGLTKAAAPTPSIEQRPYRIRAVVSFDPATRIDVVTRSRLVDAWQSLAHRFVGAAWDIQVADPDSPADALDPSSAAAIDLKPLGKDVDKVWLIRGEVDGGALVLSGRELDVATGWLGSLHLRKVGIISDLPRELFRLSDAMFAPFAEIGEPVGDRVPLRVQGVAVGGGGDRVAPVGSVFRPIRVFLKEDGAVADVQKILHSYLRVDARDEAKTITTLIRGVRDPLTKRVVRKNRLIALGIKPAAFPTRLRFVHRPDQSPGAGYSLTFRPVEKGLPREIATTDREGRVALPPGFANELVILRLIAGKAEPMVELPVMPGETDEELTISFDPRPATIALETQLDSLRDAIVDLVAVRSRLERRMKARETGEDWKGVEEALVEYRKLPGRETFAKRLEHLQEDAVAREAKTKQAILTKTARAQFADTKGLLDRYLDDELFRAYEDAVVRAKERDAKPKPIAKAKTARPASKPVPLTPADGAGRPAIKSDGGSIPF